MLSAPSCDRVVFLGMGSSRFAALTASALLQAQGIPAWAEYASSSVPSPPSSGTLAVGISASGATPETVAALERHAGRSATVAVTNVPGSAIEGPADVVLPLHSGPEHGGVACVSFQATLAVLLLAGRSADEPTPASSTPSAVELAASLREERGGWLGEVAAPRRRRRVDQAIAPAHRLSSALQSALMLREGPA
jgi:fructoselysine-6-P-deglycase FrlB-like protein